MSFLSVENVSRRFGSIIAVDGVSMSVESGELRAIIGPNGAGKTTFFNLISGFLTPTSGRIVFDGEDVTNLLPARRVWRGISRTFQITEVFPELSVHENLRIAVEVASGFKLKPWISRAENKKVRSRVDELLDMGGIASNAGRLVGELSHGDQRATEIMMALALNPRLLLLDEPLASLDIAHEQEIVSLVAGVCRARNVAALLVSHDINPLLPFVDRVLFMANGHSAIGTPDEVITSATLSKLYGSSVEVVHALERIFVVGAEI